MTQGMIHIYCGDGKGKTSAAVGLAVRAAGCGKKVLFTRFLKDENSGEVRVLDEIPGIEVIHVEKPAGFYHQLSDEAKKEVKVIYAGLWKEICGKIFHGSYDMLVLDEFMVACSYDLISVSDAVRFLKLKPSGLEVVLTGRDPDEAVKDLADYMSEIRKVRHPYDRGVKARKGIEY